MLLKLAILAVCALVPTILAFTTKTPILSNVSIGGDCPNIRAVPLDLKRLKGTWYRQFSKSSMDVRKVGCDGNCIVSEITSVNRTTNRIHTCCQVAYGLQPSICGDKLASGTITNDPDEALTTYLADDLVVESYELDHDPDYEEFVIAYSCVPSSVALYGTDRLEVLLVVTRSPDVCDDLRKHIFKVLAQNNINTCDVIQYNQVGCSSNLSGESSSSSDESS